MAGGKGPRLVRLFAHPNLAGLSANAASRRSTPGESDSALAYRIAKEFMTAYSTTVREATGGASTIGFFGAQALNNVGAGSFPWPILKELGQASQIVFYGQHNTANLQKMVYDLRNEKRAAGQGVGATRIIPWLTVATSGATSPSSCFDELIHVFLNGCSGDHSDDRTMVPDRVLTA